MSSISCLSLKCLKISIIISTIFLFIASNVISETSIKLIGNNNNDQVTLISGTTPPPKIHDNACKHIERFQLKEIQMKSMIGRWFGQELVNPEINQANLESFLLDITKNPNTDSNYTYLFKTIINDKDKTLAVRHCKTTGILMVKEDNDNPVELHLAFLEAEPKSHLIMYMCQGIEGAFQLFPKLVTSTRSCDLNETVRVKTQLWAQNLGIADKLTKVKSSFCG